MTDTIPDRVARGAALLDRTLGDWDERIDLDRLDLASGCNCILGQTWDEDWDEYETTPFAAHAGRLFGGGDDDIRHGFNADTGGIEWSLLEIEWRRVILARRAGEGR